jgi:hypothetical protein
LSLDAVRISISPRVLKSFAVAKVASVGFGLLIGTGFAMLMMQAQVLMEVGGKRFMFKLGLVGLQVVFFAVMQITLKRVKEAKGGPLMAKVPKIGRLLMLNGLAIVLTAVLAFH